MPNLDIILNNLKKEVSGLEWSIRYAKSTNSIYVRFYRGGYKRTVRISDHPTGKVIASCGVSATTERFLRNQVKALCRANLNDLFRQIEDRGIER